MEKCRVIIITHIVIVEFQIFTLSRDFRGDEMVSMSSRRISIINSQEICDLSIEMIERELWENVDIDLNLKE